MTYIMENATEFQRLEKQSSAVAYDFRQELSQLRVRPGAFVLDAGCGSGIVSRYLATQFPGAIVLGCDVSDQRVRQAASAAVDIENLEFRTHDLTKLGFLGSSFDVIVSRFVIEHIREEARDDAVAEMFRCLRPGGELMLIDIDGGFHNVFPQPPVVAKGLSCIAASKAVDLHIGRKLPQLMCKAGFESVTYRVETMSFQGEALETEIGLIAERLKSAQGFLEQTIGSREDADAFIEAYLDTLKVPGVVLFYNKFIVRGVKSASRNHLRLAK